MKQLHYIGALALCIASCLSAQKFENKRMQFNLGPIFNYARYDLGCLPTMQGYLAGVHTDFIYRKANSLYTQLQFDGRWNAGYISGCFDVKTKIRDYRPEWYIGYNWDLSRDCTAFLTPLIGLGFYYLSNELQPDVMRYRYFNLYVPVGLEALWKVCEDQFDIGLRAIYRIDAYTKLKLSTPCVDLCECDKISLKRSQGVHLELPMTWYKGCRTWKRFQIKVVPFFDWNRFGRADQANENGVCFDVPKLDRWYLGARLDFGIRF